mmetsp:Transcript_98729/g.318392  ORF Transcript_98729/g.318392 Transcript_98729/m.318392 type:complete len:226 (-) Transcript_98729:383-1060(-)
MDHCIVADDVGLRALVGHPFQPTFGATCVTRPRAGVEHRAVAHDIWRAAGPGHAAEPGLCPVGVASARASVDHRVVAHDIGFYAQPWHAPEPGLRSRDLAGLGACGDDHVCTDGVGPARPQIREALQPALGLGDVARLGVRANESPVADDCGLRLRLLHAPQQSFGRGRVPSPRRCLEPPGEASARLAGRGRGLRTVVSLLLVRRNRRLHFFGGFGAFGPACRSR